MEEGEDEDEEKQGEEEEEEGGCVDKKMFVCFFLLFPTIDKMRKVIPFRERSYDALFIFVFVVMFIIAWTVDGN
jgi:hypothetical protein